MSKSHLLGALCAGIIAYLSHINATADPVSGQGTWETTLQGCNLDGDTETIEAYYDNHE